ncbi:hypothetical protein [Cellulomonas wangsupingiae]|uniref:hypothetical protein n=1 Tax=Cellulomonas wangsupingiae TaxID=2968085 RepID=UPI001D0E0813|nr:hypothetical protein [Cellulomonas wangsupingiae]MCM0638079.1 hypothetical protein [Cellulomonas wangsupingiae]
MPADLTVARIVGQYLADPPVHAASTARAHRWALGGLRDVLGDEPVVAVLTTGDVVRWITAPTADGREPAAATVRQRAGAVRALLRFGVERGHLDAATADAAQALLRRPATPPVVRAATPAALLLDRLSGGRPHGVSWHVWVRFRAHVSVLAASGATERDLGRAHVADLGAGAVDVRLGGARHPLGDAARLAVQAWLPVRSELVASLQGSPPPQLWVRAHPSVHPRTGAVAAVGMPITARGLRKAFADVVAGLAGEDPRLADCTVAHVRQLAGRPAGAGEPAGPRPVGPAHDAAT